MGETAPETDYESQTVADLKVLLPDAGLPVSGRKAELIARITEAEQADWGSFTYFELKKLNEKFVEQIKSIQPNYADLKVKVLKNKLKEKGLKVSGKKELLVKRLMDDWEEKSPHNLIILHLQ